MTEILHARNEEPFDGGRMSSEFLRSMLFSPETLLYDCFPGGNDTFIVVNEKIERDWYGKADSLIRERFSHFEQGGFLERSRDGGVVRLQMAGGEFCGNAARSVAALIAEDFLSDRRTISVADYSKVSQGETGLRFPIEVSGTDQIINATVKIVDGEFEVAVDIPFPQSWSGIEYGRMSVNSLECNYSLIRMDGIVHVLVERASVRFLKDQNYFSSCLREIRRNLDLEATAATGLIWYEATETDWRIDPVVYVQSINTCVYESACGSGSAALALLVAKDNREDVELAVLQPSGYFLNVSVATNGERKEIALAGRVQLLGDLNRFLGEIGQAV